MQLPAYCNTNPMDQSVPQPLASSARAQPLSTGFRQLDNATNLHTPQMMILLLHRAGPRTLEHRIYVTSCFTHSHRVRGIISLAPRSYRCVYLHLSELSDLLLGIAHSRFACFGRWLVAFLIQSFFAIHYSTPYQSEIHR